MTSVINLDGRNIGEEFPPLVIAEIGINHEGSFEKAKQMINDAHESGAECVKFQCHILDDEMIPNAVIPGNAKESIWEIIKRCSLTEDEEIELKKITEKLGMIFLSTPFSRKAVDRLAELGVCAFKIGSGECNNHPLLKHISSYHKPVLLSTGMNNIETISKSISILENEGIEYALLHTTSMYPTPYINVRLNALNELKINFPNAVIGLSDHSIGNYTCFGAVSLGACILEKHFTSNKNWPGPDIPISINSKQLQDLIIGSKAIFQARNGSKSILKEEQPTIDFAYSCVVSIKPIQQGEKFSKENIWVKRPGNGEILAQNYEEILGKLAIKNISNNVQISKSDVEWEKKS
jgi:sialic acid synthase SpsE